MKTQRLLKLKAKQLKKLQKNNKKELRVKMRGFADYIRLNQLQFFNICPPK